MKSKLLRVLWPAIGVALLAVVVWRCDPDQAWQHAVAALDHWPLLVGAAALLAAAGALFFLKWHVMSRLAAAGASWRQSLRLFGTLFLVGTFTPGRAGELAVPLLMRGGARLTSVALVNRVLEGATTVAMGTIALLAAFTSQEPVRDAGILSAVLAGLFVMLVVLSRRRLSERLVDAARWCLRPLARWPRAARLLEREDKLREALGPFYEANERLLRWHTVLLLAGMMVAIWLVMVGANWLLIRATVREGPSVALLDLVAVIAVIAVSMFLSPTPGGIGVSEGAAVLFLRQLGYTQNFVPMLLLSRLGFYAVVCLVFAAGQLLGRPLGARSPDVATDLRPQEAATPPS